MTVDERIEKLVERHEALGQSVELLTHDVKLLEVLVREITGGIRDLAAIARSHEARLSHLEE